MMTDSITAQQVSTRYPTLPDEIRSAISDPTTYETIEKIGMRHGLTKVESGLLAQSTSLLMMGFIRPTEYVNEIVDLTAATRDQVAFIAQEINRDIFNPVKDALKKVHNMNSAPLSTPTERPKVELPPMPPKQEKPVEKLNIPFSVNAALGNASQAAPSAPTQPPANIFEKKLTEQFRMKSDAVSVQGSQPGHPKVPHKPTQVVPPPVTPEPPQSKPVDPYRETFHP